MISRITSIKRINTNPELICPTKKNYDIKQPIARAGNEYIWKLYHCLTEETNQECTLFVFEKRIMEKVNRFSNKREVILDSLKRELLFLERFKHSQILKIIAGIEESRNFMTFVSEPVLGSLSNFVKKNEKWPFQIPKHIKNYKFYDIEVILGLYQIIDALRYINSSHEMVHGNINPNNILICKHGHWKLSGFNLAETIAYNNFKTNSYISKTDRAFQTDLDFTAPEVQKHGHVTPISDIFSTGLVIVTIYNNGISPLQCYKSVSAYNKRLDELPSLFSRISEKIPRDLIEPLRKLLCIDIKNRPTPQLISMLKCFNEPFIKNLETFLSLEYKSMNQKKMFFNNFSKLVAEYPKDLRYERILPLLMEWFQQSEILASFVLPSILTILHKSTEEEFQEYLSMNLKYIIKSEKNIQTTIVLLDLIEFFVTRLKDDELLSELINNLLNCLEDQSVEAQEAAINAFIVLKDYFNTSEFSLKLLIKLKNLINKTHDPKIEMPILECVNRLLDNLDRDIVLDHIIPLLLQIDLTIPSKLMAVLEIYRHFMTNNNQNVFPSVIIANTILPSIIPVTVDSNLSLQEFKITMDTVRMMLDKIERSRFGHVKQENGGFTQNSSCSSFGSMYNNSCRVPLISMQQPTVDIDSRRNSNNFYSYQDRLNKRSMSGEYYHESFDNEISKSAILMNRMRPSNQVLDNSIYNHRNLSSSSTPDRRLWNKTNSNPSFNIHLSANSRELSSAHSLQIIRRHSGNLPVQNDSSGSRNSTSLLVPEEFNPRRHSYGSQCASSVNSLITANICEGPFITPPGSKSASRRTSAQSLGPTVVPTIPNRNMMNPINRRSSFNSFSDSVFNFFNPLNKA